MGSLLLAAGAKGKRYALPHSRILIHQSRAGSRDRRAISRFTQREALRLREILNDILAHHTGQNVKKIEKEPTATTSCPRRKQSSTDLSTSDSGRPIKASL